MALIAPFGYDPFGPVATRRKVCSIPVGTDVTHVVALDAPDNTVGMLSPSAFAETRAGRIRGPSGGSCMILAST
jgi:hypothetical protein